MWINSARFQGSLGYVLKSELQRTPLFDPSDPATYKADPLKLTVRVSRSLE